MTAAERYREAIERVIAKAPPLSAEQRTLLRVLLAATTPTP